MMQIATAAQEHAQRRGMDSGSPRNATIGLGLGIFSIGLGLVELVAARRIAATLDAGDHVGVVRAFGVREIVAGAGLLANPANASGVWSRVAGDAMDAAALLAAARRSTDNRAIWGALAFVAGAAVIDIAAARHLDRTTGRTFPKREPTPPAPPPRLLESGWRESRKTVNGLTLHVVEAGPADGALVILLHGFPEFWWAWRHQITPLADAGYHVVVPDLRGYNESDAPQEVSAYHLDTLADDVAALADAYGRTRFSLVGHDWGAVIGWHAAARHGHRIERAVLMDGPHPDVWGRQAARHPTQAARSTYVAAFQLPWLPEAALGALDFAGLRAMMRMSARADTFAPGDLDRYAEAWAHPGSLTAMLNYYRALRERPTRAEPERLTPPTLILWAGNDKFLERHVAEAGLALCDRGRLEVVEGASHWLHLEEPERINRAILAFLAETGAPTQE